MYGDITREWNIYQLKSIDDLNTILRIFSV